MTEHPTLDIGTTLGERYELTEEIGEGGFGKIFRGRQLNIAREVAVKVLPPKFSSVENVVERFRREARLASQLRHPNTITIHDYGRQDDFFFIVMELLKGQDLADRLEEVERLSMDRSVHVGRQTLRSLREAHDFGIIHRDLKPENIFLTTMDSDPDYVKVLDFGIAKLATHDPELFEQTDSEDRNLTVQGNTVGTPQYMSPEQAAAEEIGPPSDLYTVGLILFEMVNGHPPFDKERPAKTMRAHLFDSVPSFSNAELRNTRFESVVRKALAKEPDERFSEAEEFLDALSDPDLGKRSLGAVQLGETTNPRQEDDRDSSESDEPSDPEDTRSADESTDSVPFQEVPDQRDESRPPPEGFSAEDDSAGSSIVTVLDEPGPDEDVIVLTNKKEQDGSDDEADDTPKPDAETAEPDSEEKRRATPAESTTPDADDQSAGQGDWSWGEEVNATDASGSQLLTDYQPGRRRRRGLTIAAIIAAAVAVLVVLVVTGVVPVPI